MIQTKHKYFLSAKFGLYRSLFHTACMGYLPIISTYMHTAPTPFPSILGERMVWVQMFFYIKVGLGLFLSAKVEIKSRKEPNKNDSQGYISNGIGSVHCGRTELHHHFMLASRHFECT